jgi:hypothetical protein
LAGCSVRAHCMIRFVGWLLGELLAAGGARRTIQFVGWLLRELLAAERARRTIDSLAGC